MEAEAATTTAETVVVAVVPVVTVARGSCQAGSNPYAHRLDLMWRSVLFLLGRLFFAKPDADWGEEGDGLYRGMGRVEGRGVSRKRKPFTKYLRVAILFISTGEKKSDS